MSRKTSTNQVRNRQQAVLGVAQRAAGAAPQAQERLEASTLGIYANLSSPPPAWGKVEREQRISPALARDEVKTKSPAAMALAEQAIAELIRGQRAKRFDLLATARSVLLASPEAQRLKHPHNVHRTCKCAWIPNGSLVAVNKAIASKKAFYSGLTTCGSVWTCPVCCAKVQERRREEIATAVSWVYGEPIVTAIRTVPGRENGQAMMVTLTFPHKYWDKLAELLKQQKDALVLFRGGKAWDKEKKRIGFDFLIRSLEITRGANGWHPHTHELWFLDADIDVKALLKKLRRRWLAACINVGLVDPLNISQVRAFMRYAVDVKPNCSTSDYLAKQDSSRHWGVDREMSKASSKAGKAKGKHAFELLAEVQAGAEGTAHAAELFREYAKAMFGKQQLRWSPGSKKRLGIKDLKDEQIAEEMRETALKLGLINHPDWRRVRAKGKRAYVLDLAEKVGWSAVQDLLAQLAEEDAVQSPSADSPTQVGEEARGAANQYDEFGKIDPCGSAKAPPQGGAVARPLHIGSGTDPIGISAQQKLGAA